MLNLFIVALAFWFLYNIVSYSLIIYPFHILLSLTKYITWVGLGIVIIFLAWCFADE